MKYLYANFMKQYFMSTELSTFILDNNIALIYQAKLGNEKL